MFLLISNSPSIHQPFSRTFCIFLQKFVNLNVRQLIISSAVWFSQSEVMLHSKLMLQKIEKCGEQDKEYFQEWLFNMDPEQPGI